jgi:hypothetical protein
MNEKYEIIFGILGKMHKNDYHAARKKLIMRIEMQSDEKYDSNPRNYCAYCIIMR